MRDRCERRKGHFGKEWHKSLEKGNVCVVVQWSARKMIVVVVPEVTRSFPQLPFPFLSIFTLSLFLSQDSSLLSTKNTESDSEWKSQWELSWAEPLSLSSFILSFLVAVVVPSLSLSAILSLNSQTMRTVWSLNSQIHTQLLWIESFFFSPSRSLSSPVAVAMEAGEDCCVKVAVHIRPLIGDEKLQGCKDCVTVVPGKPQVPHSKKKSYFFLHGHSGAFFLSPCLLSSRANPALVLADWVKRIKLLGDLDPNVLTE